MKAIGFAVLYVLFFTTLASIVFVATIATQNTNTLEANEARFKANRRLAEQLEADRWTQTEHIEWLRRLKKLNPNLVLPEIKQ